MAKQKPQSALPLTELKPDGRSGGKRPFPTEAPVALTYNGMSHVVMMATPADLEEFAIGFTVSEEIVASADEIEGVEIFEAEKGFVAKIDIPKARFDALLERGRNLVGQTGCGICGVAEIEEAVRAYPKIETKPKAGKQAIFKALATLPQHQPQP